MSYALWTVQILLALIFAFGGGVKLVAPIDVLEEQMQLSLPGAFLRFIGLAELLGALGLILPGVFHIRVDLTPLAASGLAALMLGAVMFTPPGAPALATLPVVLALLAAFVAYGRSRLAPHRGSRGSSRPSALVTY
jgi:hypothetical protein